MAKLTDEHKNTLEKAIGLFRLRLKKQPIPRFRKQLNADIKRLYDIGYFIDEHLCEPTFTNLHKEPCELAV